ncbi:MAG: serine protease [Thermodesulfobacteriota bacterium]
MRRLARLLALCLLLALPAPARAMDAQKVFARTSGSVVVVLGLNGFNRPEKFGSGFVVEDGTRIITNYHVIEGASEVVIKTPDDKVAKVEVVDTDSIQDLALLKLDGAGPPLEIATELPQVGQEVAAIGSPKGLERTLSTGIVSALRKQDGREVVQITAPVSQGSSGGPVLDAEGRVVGVASFGAKEGQNLNFAIPCTTLLRFLGRPAAQRKSFEPAPEQRLEVEKGADGSITIIQKKKR